MRKRQHICRVLIGFCLALLATCAAQAARKIPFYSDQQDLLMFTTEEGMTNKVTTVKEWESRRADILKNMERVMGPLPDAPRRVPLDVKEEEQKDTEKYIQKKISFVSEDNDRVPAYLLIPKGLEGPVPAVLCLHQTLPMGKDEPIGYGSRDLDYARELAERGYVTLAPDYPSFGEYRPPDGLDSLYSLGYESMTMKGVWNHMRAVDLLQSLPEVDGERIGCIGHSLGGHNTLFVSAFDERIKVAVTSCGFTSFPKYKDGNLAAWAQRKYMPRVRTEFECDSRKMPFDFSEVLAAIAPRFVFVNAPLRDSNFSHEGVKDCMDAARPVYALQDAEDRLKAVYPDAGHSFPPEARSEAYAFIDRALKGE